ncbi:MAG: hypothetical protein HN368_06355, partial [Spirochaetales bacterium]|nr:hypothetical protein [Spirochaetales bacterium]
MEFTLGDIVVLVVVAIALFAYRQFDKNNQSLSKVKRFTDKVRDELGGFVESKTEELKNLTIELDVHMKTAREILKRASGIEEDLRGRTKGVDEISKRISRYDKALTDLVNMTQKVDENLTRLHNESLFVDTVGKRVKDAISQMNQIEKTIPSLRAEFGRANADQLKSLSGEVVRATEELVDSIAEELARSQESVREFSEHTEQLEAKRDIMEEETLNNLRNRFQELLVEADDSRQKLMGRFSSDIGQLLEQEEGKGRELIDDIQLQQGNLREEVATTQDLLNEKLEAFQDRITRVEDDYQRALREAAEKGRSLEDEVFIKLKDHVEARARSVENTLAGVMSDSKERLEASRKELVQMFGETRSEITVWRAELQKKMGDSVVDFDQKYRVFSAEIEARLETILADTGRTQEQQKHDLTEFIQSTTTEIDNLERAMSDRVAQLAVTIQEREKEFKSNLESAMTNNEGVADRVQGSMNEVLLQFEEGMNQRFSDVELKVTQYEDNVNYRFSRVEEVHEDIEALEENLKKNMDLAVGRARESLKVTLGRISDERVAEKKNAEVQLSEIRNSMDAIDNELTELKSRAYANVSEKLQVFEDDFFADLNDRNSKIEENVLEWQQKIETEIHDVSTEQVRVRSEAEREFSQELKNKLSELQTDMVGQYDRIGSQVNDFQKKLEVRMTGTEGSLEGLENRIKEDMADLRRASTALMESELSDYSDKIGLEIREHESEVTSNLRILGERVEDSGRNINGVLESAAGDVSAWQQKVLEEMRDAKSTVNEEFESFREAFQIRQNELATATADENTRLREDLEETRTIVDRTSEELAAASREYTGEFTRNADAFMSVFHKKVEEIQLTADETVRDFKTQVGDTRDRIESIQQRLQLKIDEGYRSLSSNLEEIDRKQKGFIGQTKLFERADTLKESLQVSVDGLKADITRLEEHKSDLRSTEKEFNRVRKLGEDVSEKVGRFIGEKRRIDAMDEDFKRLIGISQTIDVKLEQVTSSHDTIQEIQAKFRDLEELERE